jgi:hypothetical protein
MNGEPYLEHLDRLLEPAQLPGAHGEPAPEPSPANQMTNPRLLKMVLSNEKRRWFESGLK